MSRLFVSLSLIALFAACQRLPLKTMVDPVHHVTAEVRTQTWPEFVRARSADLVAWAWKPAYGQKVTAREQDAIAVGLDLISSP
ncbi:MAG: hypothetical protein VKP72_07210 [bacterium]|nr:hypothetical protein [bacterium]